MTIREFASAMKNAGHIEVWKDGSAIAEINSCFYDTNVDDVLDLEVESFEIKKLFDEHTVIVLTAAGENVVEDNSVS